MPTPSAGSQNSFEPAVVLACIEDLLKGLSEGDSTLRSLLKERADAVTALGFVGRTVAELLKSAGTVPSTEGFLARELATAREQLVKELSATLEEKIRELEQREQQLRSREQRLSENEGALAQARAELERAQAALKSLPQQAASAAQPGDAERLLSEARAEAEKILRDARSKAEEELATAQGLAQEHLLRAQELEKANGATVARIKREAIEAALGAALQGAPITVPLPAEPTVPVSLPGPAPLSNLEPDAASPKRKLLGPGKRRDFEMAFDRVHGKKRQARDGDQDMLNRLVRECGVLDEHELMKRIDEFFERAPGSSPAPTSQATESAPSASRRGWAPTFAGKS